MKILYKSGREDIVEFNSDDLEKEKYQELASKIGSKGSTVLRCNKSGLEYLISTEDIVRVCAKLEDLNSKVVRKTTPGPGRTGRT